MITFKKKGAPPKKHERAVGELPPFWVQQGKEGEPYFQSMKISPEIRDELIALLNAGYDRFRVYLRDRQVEINAKDGFDETKPAMSIRLIPPKDAQAQAKAPAPPPAPDVPDECPF